MMGSFFVSISFAISVLFFSTAAFAQSNPVECRFEPRGESDLLEYMPNEFVGLIQCEGKELPLNMFSVVRSVGQNKQNIMTWFSAYEKVEIPSLTSSKVVQPLKSEGGLRWMELDTARDHESFRHLILQPASGPNSDLVLVYTDTLERMKKYRAAVLKLSQTLTSTPYLEGVASALQKKNP